MLGLRGWLCLVLPWHKFVVKERVSIQSEYLRCSCGKEYGINHDVGVILPWDDVKGIYKS
jgi:hypothetical protein